MKLYEIAGGVLVNESDEGVQIIFPKGCLESGELASITKFIEGVMADKKRSQEIDLKVEETTTPSPTSPQTLTPKESDKPTSKRIIIVDDFSATRKVVTRMLVSDLGLCELGDIIEAVDGQEALSKLEKEQNIKLIISDWNMPRMTGFDLLQKVKSNPKYKDTLFLMLTSEGGVNQVKKALQAGVDNYVIKPFTCEVLREKLKQIKFM